jgi:hydrogenase 3 maturation protease
LTPTKAQKRTTDQELKKWLSDAERIVLAGIGNPIRKDDFVGVRIIQSLRKKPPKNVILIECETVPEFFAQQIIDFKPTHVLLIDAAVLDLQPGEGRLILPEKLASPPAYSSHMLPLRLFCEYISMMTNARIALLLIQPKETDFGEALSPELKVSAKKITKLLRSILNHGTKS